MYTTISEKGCQAEELIRHADVYSWLTNSALHRQTMDFDGRTLEVHSLGQAPIARTLTFDYSQPLELYYFDRLIIPRIQQVFAKATALEVTTAAKQLFTPQGLYALNHGGVRQRSFDEITCLLERRRAETIITVDFGMPKVA